MIWSTYWGQLMFLAWLKLKGFVIATEMSVVSLESVLDIGLLNSIYSQIVII